MRGLLLFVLLSSLAACAAPENDIDGRPEPIGDFRLGFSEVVAPNIQKLLISQDATAEEWTEAVDRAVEARFSRFEGSRFYHFGISVEGYSLPPPLVPGESYLAMRVTVWDDANQRKLDEDTELILTVIDFENRLSLTRDERI